MTNLEKYYDSIAELSNEFSFHDAVFMLRKNMPFVKFFKYREENEYNDRIVIQEKQDNLEWLNKSYYITSCKELKEVYEKDNNAFNGMFGETEYGDVFVIVGDKLVYQNGGYDMLNVMLEEELIVKLLIKYSFDAYNMNKFNENDYFFVKRENKNGLIIYRRPNYGCSFHRIEQIFSSQPK